MQENGKHSTQRVPPRALVLSIAALAVPVTAALAFPEAIADQAGLLWLLALVPAFLLAYYRGSRGLATALAVGMVVLVVTQVVATVLGRSVPDLLVGVLFALLAISFGIGWMTERFHQDRERAEILAFTDALTCLPNRRYAHLFLENEFAAAQRGRPLTVVMFDLDRLRDYNERYGQQAGDEALRVFGSILGQNTRSMNLSARLGEEEFMSILANSDAVGGMRFAERIRATLRAHERCPAPITVSAGVAAYSPGMRTADELIAAADHALFRAKKEGRNCVRMFGRPLLDRIFGRAPGDTPDRTSPPEGPWDEDALRSPFPSLDSSSAGVIPHQTSLFGSGRRILLVEDDETVREPLATYLSAQAFSVTQVPDASQALQELSQEFDVLITDFNLPGLSGNDLVEAGKSRWPATQAIVITGVNDAQVAAQALNAGADRYLLKPFGLDQLHDYLVEALERRDQILRERAERRLLTSEALVRAEQAHEAVLKGARALVRAVEVRDPYTRGHSERVAGYARIVAHELIDVGQRLDADALRLACELHDVGKIGIPDAILNKPGRLTAEEFEEVAKHPKAGRRILDSLLDDETVLAVITWHHERWDGRGYPDRLKGEKIPLAARLTALADTLDAMTSNRAYRPAIHWDEVVRQVVDGAGTQFDPLVVSAFQRCMPRLQQIHMEHEAQGALWS
jgi:diguanylate cyclase (GGDEF)-like protein